MLENTKLEEPTAIARHDVSEWDGLRGAGPDNGPPEPQNIDWERINSLIAGTKHEIPKLTSDVLSGMGRLDSCGLEMYEKADIFWGVCGDKAGCTNRYIWRGRGLPRGDFGQYGAVY